MDHSMKCRRRGRVFILDMWWNAGIGLDRVNKLESSEKGSDLFLESQGRY